MFSYYLHSQTTETHFLCQSDFVCCTTHFLLKQQLFRQFPVKHQPGVSCSIPISIFCTSVRHCSKSSYSLKVNLLPTTVSTPSQRSNDKHENFPISCSNLQTNLEPKSFQVDLIGIFHLFGIYCNRTKRHTKIQTWIKQCSIQVLKSMRKQFLACTNSYT